MSILNPPVTIQSDSVWCGVETYWGKIGDGKTHHLVKYRVLPALLQGRHVFTNIDFGGPVKLLDGTIILTEEERVGALLSQYLKKDVRIFFHLVDNDFFREHLVLKDMNGELLKIPKGSRVIIDEAQMLFPIDGYRAVNPLFLKLLTYCRHFDIDFVFATQNTMLLDKRIVSTSNELIMIKNLWFLSTFFKNRYQESHHQNLYAEPHQKKILSFDPEIFGLYKSSGSVVKRQGRMIPIFIVLPFLGILFVIGHFFFKGRKSTFMMGKGFIEQSQPAPVAVSTTTRPLSLIPIVPPLSSAQQAIQTLNNLKDYTPIKTEYRDSLNVSTENYHTVFHLSPPTSAKGRWILGRDGVSRWHYYKK